MRGRRPSSAEILRRLDNALSQEMHPDAVHHYSRGERMIGAGEPAGQGQPYPAGFSLGVRRPNGFTLARSAEHSKKAWLDFDARHLVNPPLQDVRFRQRANIPKRLDFVKRAPP